MDLWRAQWLGANGSLLSRLPRRITRKSSITVYAGGGKTQPPDIRIWITEAMTRYPTITDWVVVNEGWGYCNQTIPLIDESFVIAREVRPDARLWYNGLLTDTCEQEQAIRLVQLGYADAIGIQMHLNLYSDLTVFIPLLEWLTFNNIPWAITEIDIIIPVYNDYYTNLQTEMYGRVIELFLRYNGEFFSMWGVSDAVSWQASNFPLPIDLNYIPKPSWFLLAWNRSLDLDKSREVCYNIPKRRGMKELILTFVIVVVLIKIFKFVVYRIIITE